MTNPINVTSELYRTYTYADGSQFRIDSPAELHVLEDDKGTSHRIIDADGVTHRPSRGWVGISWKPKPGEPSFVA